MSNFIFPCKPVSEPPTSIPKFFILNCTEDPSLTGAYCALPFTTDKKTSKDKATFFKFLRYIAKNCIGFEIWFVLSSSLWRIALQRYVGNSKCMIVFNIIYTG